jgi:hypothetical protein
MRPGTNDARESMVIRPQLLVLLTVVLSCLACSSYNVDLQKLESGDKRFLAQLTANKSAGIAGGDWYFVELRKEHPSLQDFLTGERRTDICILRDHGTLQISWANPNQLVIVCANCSQGSLEKDRDSWQGIDIKYVFAPP